MFVNTIPEKTRGQFYLALTGFTGSNDHGIAPQDYIAAIRDSVKDGILRVRKSYPTLVVLRGSTGQDPNFDSLVAEICEELGIPQLVFTLEHWKPDIREKEATTVVVLPDDGDDTFSDTIARHCDFLMAFGGGERSAEMVRLAIFTYRKQVVLVSPYSALSLTDPTQMESIERLISRIKRTPSSKAVTVEEEIGRIVDEIVFKAVQLKHSKERFGVKSDPQMQWTLPSIDHNHPEPGVFQKQGFTVVRWLDKPNPVLPPNSEVVSAPDEDTVLCQRTFKCARLIPVDGLPSVVSQLDGVLPLGAVGYSDINAEREPLLGVDKAAYEKFVSLIMKVIAMRVKEQLTHFGTNVGFVFAGTDGGVDRGLYDAARSLECPILGVVAQKYLHYAVDEDVDIVFTPDASDYPKKFMNLLTGGAVLPIGGATHSFGQDLFRWLSQDGEVLMIINTLLELFTNQVSPAIYNGAVLNAPRVFTTCCHLVGENVPFQKLSAALVVETNGALWKLNPPHELEALSIHLASAASVKV